MQRPYSRIFRYAAMFTTAMLLVALASACTRPASSPPAALPPATPAPKPAAAVPELVEPVETTAPVTLKPASKPTSTAAKASAASSLGGHDRQLVLRPLDPVRAADFELGALAVERTNPGLWLALLALEKGLVSSKFPYELFSDKAAALARIMYPQDRLQEISSVRFAEPRTQTGGIASVGIRVFARSSGESSEVSAIKPTVRSSALGLVILVEGESGSWKVEHFELDLEALARTMERSEVWDPYSTPVQY